MTNTVIPIYSEREQIGGMHFETDGSMSGVLLNEVGSERCLAVAVSGLDFVFELVPREKSLTNSDKSITAVLNHDEQVRKEAVLLTSEIVAKATGHISNEGVADLAKRIEYFLKTGK